MGMISPYLRDVEGGGLSYYCQGCKHHHVIWLEGREPNDGRPRWSWNGDAEKPVFGPSVLVYIEEPVNLFNEEAMARDIAEAKARKEAGDPNARVPTHRRTLCHTFIGCNGAQPGEVIFLGDCEHEFAGTVQPLPKLPEWLRDQEAPA